MTLYNKWEIVVVPFPFTDLTASKKRPALIISPNSYNLGQDVVIAFVTSQFVLPARYGDYELQKWKEANLPKPSIVRMKFATINKNLIIRKLGELESVDRIEIENLIVTFFTNN